MHEFLLKYSSRMKIFTQLFSKIERENQAENTESKNIDPKSSNSNEKFKQILVQDLGLWLTNNEQNILNTFKKISDTLKKDNLR